MSPLPSAANRTAAPKTPGWKKSDENRTSRQSAPSPVPSPGLLTLTPGLPTSLIQPSMRLGATPTAGGTFFRIWAPRCRRLDVVVGTTAVSLRRDSLGYFFGTVEGVRAGARYRYRLDGRDLFPDPCSRYQPDGPHGDSVVVDPSAYRWKHDIRWPGLSARGQVIYELHVGTFTKTGDFAGTRGRLADLKKLGVTAVEIMPIHECDGRWNWGYDGVTLFAPYHVYGTPEGFRDLVDEAHRIGIGVILDVVYNHIGPSGNYLDKYSPHYFTDRYETDWGRAINFDGPFSESVRDFFLQNVVEWVAEFHVYGLRFDATQNIYDKGAPHILSEMSRAARSAAGSKSLFLLAENEPQNVRCVQPVNEGGFGFDAMWNDDFHHSARVALTGFREAYYMDYLGTPQEMVSSARNGFLYQGQYYEWQEQSRGTPAGDTPASSFVCFLENHDQVANTLDGARLHRLTSPRKLRAMTAFLFLSPGTPMIFMGQEEDAPAPFLFFADHRGKLGRAVAKGRREFLTQFPSFAAPAAQRRIPAPGAVRTFQQSRQRGSRSPGSMRRFIQDLLLRRRTDVVLSRQDRGIVDGAVLGPTSWVLRYRGNEAGDRLVIVNLGRAQSLRPAPHPVLAPPAGCRWRSLWRSDGKRGPGWDGRRFRDLPGEATLFLESQPNSRNRS